MPDLQHTAGQKDRRLPVANESTRQASVSRDHHPHQWGHQSQLEYLALAHSSVNPASQRPVQSYPKFTAELSKVTQSSQWQYGH